MDTDAPNQDPRVFLIDADVAGQRMIRQALNGTQLPIETYRQAEEFLACVDSDPPGCIVMEPDLPGISGWKMQARLGLEQWLTPIVFVAANADVQDAVRAMQRGAAGFFEKPPMGASLQVRVARAVELDARRRRGRDYQRVIESRLAQLTPRERQVMSLIIEGLSNKQIARSLCVSPRTIEVHRARVMVKMQAESVAELVRLGLRCAITGVGAALQMPMADHGELDVVENARMASIATLALEASEVVNCLM